MNKGSTNEHNIAEAKNPNPIPAEMQTSQIHPTPYLCGRKPPCRIEGLLNME